MTTSTTLPKIDALALRVQDFGERIANGETGPVIRQAGWFVNALQDSDTKTQWLDFLACCAAASDAPGALREAVQAGLIPRKPDSPLPMTPAFLACLSPIQAETMTRYLCALNREPMDAFTRAEFVAILQSVKGLIEAVDVEDIDTSTRLLRSHNA